MNFNTTASRAINGSLEVRVGKNPEELGTLVLQGKRKVIHLGIYPPGKERDPWVNATDVLSPTRYVRHPLIQKLKLHLWDYPQELWGIMNQEQLWDIWE